MRYRPFFVLAVVMAAAMVFFACGSNDATDNGSVANVASATEAAESVQSEQGDVESANEDAASAQSEEDAEVVVVEQEDAAFPYDGWYDAVQEAQDLVAQGNEEAASESIDSFLMRENYPLERLNCAERLLLANVMPMEVLDLRYGAHYGLLGYVPLRFTLTYGCLIEPLLLELRTANAAASTYEVYDAHIQSTYLADVWQKTMEIAALAKRNGDIAEAETVVEAAFIATWDLNCLMLKGLEIPEEYLDVAIWWDEGLPIKFLIDPVYCGVKDVSQRLLQVADQDIPSLLMVWAEGLSFVQQAWDEYGEPGATEAMWQLVYAAMYYGEGEKGYDYTSTAAMRARLALETDPKFLDNLTMDGLTLRTYLLR